MNQKADLLSLVLHLRPLEEHRADGERPLPAWWGRAAHALMLDVIRSYDPPLAERLHDDENAPRPFTVSNLMGKGKHKALLPEQTYALRLTSLDASITAVLLQALAKGGVLSSGAIIELDYIPLRVEKACTQAEEHPWAHTTSYQELSAPYLLAKEMPSRRISLSLTSPTTFKSNDMYYPFPAPRLVFGSLLTRWNTFAPVVLPPEAQRYAEACMAVSRYRLSTRRVAMKGGGARGGCVGEVTFATTRYDKYWMSLMHLLANYSLFAGLGAGTTMGMGQSRPQAFPLPDPAED